jgi:hypothetical protein
MPQRLYAKFNGSIFIIIRRLQLGFELRRRGILYEFLVKAAQLRVESGAKLSFQIMATHFFMVNEEAEPPNTVKAWLIEGEKRTALDFKENSALKTLEGTTTLSRKGAALLVAHLQEPIESLKAEGSARAQKSNERSSQRPLSPYRPTMRDTNKYSVTSLRSFRSRM